MKKIQVYCDLDGVHVDLLSQVKKYYPKYADGITRDDITAEMWHQMFTYEEVSFFSCAPSFFDSSLLAKFLDKNSPDWIVLSALPNPKHGHTYNALRGKQLWVQDHFGFSQPAIFCLRSHKQSYAVDGSILIDDSPENIENWKRHGGIGILHKTAAMTIVELESCLMSL